MSYGYYGYTPGANPQGYRYMTGEQYPRYSSGRVNYYGGRGYYTNEDYPYSYRPEINQGQYYGYGPSYEPDQYYGPRQPSRGRGILSNLGPFLGLIRVLGPQLFKFGSFLPF